MADLYIDGRTQLHFDSRRSRAISIGAKKGRERLDTSNDAEDRRFSPQVCHVPLPFSSSSSPLFSFSSFPFPCPCPCRPLRRRGEGGGSLLSFSAFFSLFFPLPLPLALPFSSFQPFSSFSFFFLFFFFFRLASVSLGKIYKSSVRARERQDHSSAGRLVGGNGFVAAEVVVPQAGKRKG